MSKSTLTKTEGANTRSSPLPGSDVTSRWRRLADSWVKAVEKLDPLDPLACSARTRAQAYRDCADEIEAEIVPLDLLRRADDANGDAKPSLPGSEFALSEGFGHPWTKELGWDLMEIRSVSEDDLTEAILYAERDGWMFWMRDNTGSMVAVMYRKSISNDMAARADSHRSSPAICSASVEQRISHRIILHAAQRSPHAMNQFTIEDIIRDELAKEPNDKDSQEDDING